MAAHQPPAQVALPPAVPVADHPEVDLQVEVARAAAGQVVALGAVLQAAVVVVVDLADRSVPC